MRNETETDSIREQRVDWARKKKAIRRRVGQRRGIKNERAILIIKRGY